MKKVLIIAFCLLVSGIIFAQNNALILNDAVVVNITNGAVISVAQTNQAGIARTGTGTGYIQSEGQLNRVAWHINNGTGSYVIPFGVSGGSQIPFTYNVTAAGSASGTLIASTVPSANDNTPFPTVAPAVTNTDACYPAGACQNRSLYTIDRYLILRKLNWATEPNSNISMSYQTVEFGGANTITETNLGAQYWETNQWLPGWFTGPLPIGTADAANNRVTGIDASTVGGGSGNIYTWTLVDKSNPLPVELADLKASCTDNQFPIIEWVTLTETNNDYFTLQRSQDAANWIEITTISGAGNSNNPLYYSYVDETAPEGNNYYRLIQTDFDGTSVEAGMVDVRCEQSEIAQGTYNMNIYSDYEHQIHVTFYAENNEEMIMQLFDMRGRLVWNSKMTSTEGMNHVKLDIIPVQDATYLFNLTGKNKTETKRFFLQ
ncbi:MAG: T9SS type A sorting domain-containing protein [Bacteroidales bacterium]|nr:T9SS type A sorting domain-containing protein [Bacteroidales bacterium]